MSTRLSYSRTPRPVGLALFAAAFGVGLLLSPLALGLRVRERVRRHAGEDDAECTELAAWTRPAVRRATREAA